MDEKTETLRDLFVDVAGTDTVTEDQRVGRGTLANFDEGDLEDYLSTIVARMGEAFDFEADLAEAERVELVRRFYRGEDDETIADALSRSVETIRRGRLELHLFRERDTSVSVGWETLSEHLRETEDEGEVAASLSLEEDAVRWYRRVLAAREEARGVSHRYRSAFRDVIPDADLADRLTEGVTDDGLEEAAADIETDVSF